mgnify:CR=1 FL=1
MREPIDLSIGIKHQNLTAHLAANQLTLTNPTQQAFGDIRLTISYFDSDARYLDFEDIDVDAIEDLELNPVGAATSATIDISAQHQTFLKRHWKLICTITAVTWAVIILARRLAP